jgi:hypothetical protein
MTGLAHRRVARLDRLDTEECQRRILLRLVRRAQQTRFGREHDFARIRTIEDYQQRVPLAGYESFWSRYWQPAFPCLDNVTWPGRIRYFALSSGTTSGSTRYIPVSSSMLRCNRRAALTALAFFLHAHPNTALFSGQLFFLGGSTDLRPLGPWAWAGDLSGIAARTASAWMRPLTFPPLPLALLDDWDRKLDLLVEQAVRLPITMLSGVPSWLLVLFDRLRRHTGCTRIAEVWPGLRLLLHGGVCFEPYRRTFREQLGPDLHFHETYPASEGFIAAEDPRWGLLRLIPDQGLFFEFVPREELTADRPTRHTLSSLEPGVPYAVILTTCAGLWSYVLGDVVCFEQRRPPLLRFLGRTQQHLSAFGEHLMGVEVEQAVAGAAEAVGVSVVDFHVGPVFAEQSSGVGRHCYLIELDAAISAAQKDRFAREIDARLTAANEDYAAHRAGDLTLGPPQVELTPPGGFAAWLRHGGQLGGQHKVPRLDNSGQMTRQMALFFQSGRWPGREDTGGDRCGRLL